VPARSASFVQIYREQVYDLLNVASLAASPAAQPQPQQQAGGLRGGPGRALPWRPGGGLGGPLRMRWSREQDFHLENLFSVRRACMRVWSHDARP
jgi:hypothetical protein